MYEDKRDDYGTEGYQNTDDRADKAANESAGESREDSTYRMNFTDPTPEPEPQKEPYQEPYQEPKPRRQSRRERRGGRRRRPFLRALLCGIICGVVILAFLLAGFAIGGRMLPENSRSITVNTNDENLAASSETADSSETTDAEEAETASAGQYTVAQIAENCGSSVVAITNMSVQEVMTMFGTFEQESEGEGSGVIVGLTDDELLIATNYHVVEEASELSVCFFDSEDSVYSAQVKGTDQNNDLAVVSVAVSDMDADVLDRISIATMGNSDSMKVGDEVVAIGNALGLGQSVTAGIVSAIDREVTIDDYTANLIQTDAAINPGNSGGALFNMNGELIGINNAKFASDTIEGMGYAIPMSTAQPIIETLMSQETRERLDSDYGWLNISGQDVSSDMTSSYGMPTGIYVTDVAEDGAAANAGIQTGDIITALDGISLTSIETLRERLHYYKAGESVEVTVERNEGNGYEPVNLVVELDNASDYETESSSSQDQDMEGENGYYGDQGDNGYYYYDYGDSGSGDNGFGGYDFGFGW